MSPSPAPARVDFFPGQRLEPGDLRAAQDEAREMRWLHNRALHDWGVVSGLAVRGERGASSVRVEAGLAHDELGRELILGGAVDLGVPPVAGPPGGERTFQLTIAYAEDADVEPQRRGGPCGAEGAVRRPEGARVGWREEASADAGARPRAGIDIVLAEAAVSACRLAAPLSSAARREAAGATRPHIASGATPAGATAWRPWPEAAPVGVATWVSTAGGVFRATPAYQAHVAGERLVAGPPPFVVDGQPHVADASPGGFELRVPLVSGVTPGPSRSHVVAWADLVRAAASVLAGFPFGGLVPPDLLLAVNGISPQAGALVAGRPLLSPPLPPPLSRVPLPVRGEDVLAGAAPIAAAVGAASPEALLADNGVVPPALEIGRTLVGPSAGVPLNPAERVRVPGVAGLLRDALRWHVVWLGVEA